ncbi:MAG: ferredoxin [Chloroflexi bacterium]|nr:ferredoxin [Chloroflexota bacterium]
MKPVVDHTLCEGHARCEETAPQVFEVDENDKSQVLVEVVPEELRDRVDVAVRVCPRQAISLEGAS